MVEKEGWSRWRINEPSENKEIISYGKLSGNEYFF